MSDFFYLQDQLSSGEQGTEPGLQFGAFQD